jgi:integrase
MAIRKVKTKKLGLRYAVRVHLGDGKYEILGTYPTRAAAKEREATWLLKRDHRAKKTGNEWAYFYLEGYEERVKSSSYSTAKAGIRCWRKTFGNRTLGTIDSTEAEEWARQNPWALPPVITMLNYAVKRDVIQKNVFSGLSQRSSGRRHLAPLSVPDLERLADAAEKHHGEMFRAFVLFTAYSGMRVGEVFALRWSDIDFDAQEITVRWRLYRGEMDLPKGNKVRRITLLPEAAAALSSLDRSTRWVFLAKRGGQLSQSTLNHYWQKITASFGREVDPHELRHFCGHYLHVTRNIPDRVVAAQLGHSDGGKLVRELYGHPEHGAMDELKRLYGENVVPFQRKVG